MLGSQSQPGYEKTKTVEKPSPKEQEPNKNTAVEGNLLLKRMSL
jgi:hypothetical protein